MIKRSAPVLLLILLCLPPSPAEGTPLPFPRALPRRNRDLSPQGIPPFRQTHLPPAVHSLPAPTEHGAPGAIQLYLDRYGSDEYRPWLEDVWRRSLPFRWFIRRQIEEKNLPWELAFLPAVESAFQTRAVSSSAAVGLWQFMLNSIGPYDMIVDRWRDDRRDFWLSTLGALEKLKYNYSVLGDWYLALAAYNCGLGRVTRTIEGSGIADYWELRARELLPRETLEYVPRFLAMAHLLGYPGRRGLPLSWEPTVWTRIPLNQTVDLRILAQKAGIPYSLLKEAHTELHYPITPPGEDKYALKIPASHADAVREVLGNRSNRLLRYYVHRIGSGETFYALARHYGVSVKILEEANPRLKPTLLRVGDEVLIPALKEVEPYRAEEEETLVFTGVHRVKKGETLWALSRLYGVSPETLARNNGLKMEDILKAGSRLQVPERP